MDKLDPTQTYFKKRIIKRFMSPDDFQGFHYAYTMSNSRPVPQEIDTYRIEVIQRFMTPAKFKRFYKQYQESKVPTTFNLHYGKEMEELIRKVVREELNKELL